MNNLKKLSIIAASLLLIFLLLNSAQATGAQILGCVAKEGVLRIIGMGSRKEKCNKNETLISWNSEGQIGLEGPQGPKGDTGANGENATELHLYDTNNQDLGIVIDADPSSKFISFNKDLGVSLIFSAQDATLLPLHLKLGFEGSDCTGMPFELLNRNKIPLTPSTLVISSDSRYFRAVGSTHAQSGSSYLNDVGICENGATTTISTYSLQNIILPFSEPVAWPLHINSEIQ